MEKVMTIIMMLGVVLIIIGKAFQFGTTKDQRTGKEQTDKKTNKKIKIGYLLISIGFIIIFGIMIFIKRKN